MRHRGSELRQLSDGSGAAYENAHQLRAIMLAPAQTYASLAALTGGCRPRASAPLRPVGCIRGLGGRVLCHSQLLPPYPYYRGDLPTLDELAPS
jgi:hypothetical protein